MNLPLTVDAHVNDDTEVTAKRKASADDSEYVLLSFGNYPVAVHLYLPLSDVDRVMAELSKAKSTPAGTSRAHVADDDPPITDPDNEFYSGCTEGCPNNCQADHRGEE